MAEFLKILGQAMPTTANADTSLYTVPALTQTTVSSIIVANTTTTSATFQIHVLTAAGSSSAATALFLDNVVAGKASVIIQAGIVLAAGSVIVVQASTASALNCTAFGQEIN